MLYLRTPANATQLNPVTTILSQVVIDSGGVQVQEAENLMKEVWQLPGAYDIVEDDILWLSLNPYLDVKQKGPSALVKMAQAEVLACCVAMTLAGARNQTWPDDQIATAAYSSIASLTLARGLKESTLRRMNFSEPTTAEEVAVGAAASLGGSLSLSPVSLRATGAIVSKLCLTLVSLLDIHEETRDIQEFSLPVEIAAVSRDANTKVGQDLRLLASNKLSLEAFEDLHLKEKKNNKEEKKEEGTPTPTPPLGLSEEAFVEFEGGEVTHTHTGGGILETWQMYLLGFGGGPALVVVVFLFVKRRRKGKSEKLLNLVERHNLLSENDSHDKGQWGEGGGFGDLELHAENTTTTTTSMPAPPPSPSEAYRDPAFDHAGNDTAADSVGEMDAFGSPQKIRHRPPKSYTISSLWSAKP
jgi:hypothetical protein